MTSSATSPSWRTPALVLACAAVVLTIGMGVRQTFGLFLQPVSLAHGWGREVFSLANAMQLLLWGVFQPFVGAIADKYGAGRVIVAGAISYALGLALIPYCQSPLWLNLSMGVLIGFGVAACTFGVVLSVVARAVSAQKRSLALGIASAAGSFGQFAIVPLGHQLIDRLDWAPALFTLAFLVLLIVPFAAGLTGKSAHHPHEQQSVSEALREAFAHKSFHLLFWSFFVCGFHVALISLHLPSYVKDMGLAPVHGVTALALIGLGNIVGSYTSGLLGGRYSKKYLLSGIYFMRAVFITLLLLLPLTPLTLYLFAAAIGFLWLGTVPLTNGLVAQIFGLKYVSMLYGIVFLGHQLGSFLGSWLGGRIFDATGSYQLAWLIAIALGVLAALVSWPIDERTLQRKPAVGTA